MMSETVNRLDPRPSRVAGRRWWLGLGVALFCAAYLAGRNSRPFTGSGSSPHQVLYYVDPMHPAYRSEKPGKAPDCGMDLEPVYAGGVTAKAEGMRRGNLRLTPEHEQAVRLQTEQAQAASSRHGVHTVGRVAPDETLTYRVSAGVDGWVRRVFSDRTGTQVKRGQALAAFYSKELTAPQQAYIYALESCERLRRAPPPSGDPLNLAMRQLANSRDNLLFLGMGEPQIEELGTTRTEAVDVNLTAPADGRVLERHVAVGQRFMKGELLYRIANTDLVWVLADVHSGDLALLGPIGSAQIRIEGAPPIEARVAPVPPQFDDQGRTGKLRLEVNNRRGNLVPGMIVDVRLDGPARFAVTVPADAVIDSGTKKRVFVALGGGEYEPREVETGWLEGDRVEIRGGLGAGERVVTAGAFLLDSESRMKSPAGDVTDAACGMTIARAGARRLELRGATYYFCSEACERKFRARRVP